MKRSVLTMITAFTLMYQAYGIGISPARRTFDLLEFDCTFNSNIGYTLYRPSTRYSTFTITDPVGMNATFLEFSAPNSVEFLSEGNIRIDWNSEELLSGGGFDITVNFQSPTSWNCPVEPGGSYMADLMVHRDVVESSGGIGASLAVVSQIALYRNYAPRAYALSCPDSVAAGQCANFVLQLEDKQVMWSSENPDNPFFFYDIDWDGDGIIDLSSSASFDAEPEPYWRFPSIYIWSDEIQTSLLSLDHVYDAAGDYTATITVRDSKESTTLAIPIHVVPEPVTFLLLGLGGLAIRRKP